MPRVTCVITVSCLGDRYWASERPQLLNPGSSEKSKDVACSKGLLWGVRSPLGQVELSGGFRHEDPPYLSSVSLSPEQGSTLRKRKMYEEFLSKVSILGRWRPALHGVSVLSEHLPVAQPPPHGVASTFCVLGGM